MRNILRLEYLFHADTLFFQCAEIRYLRKGVSNPEVPNQKTIIVKTASESNLALYILTFGSIFPTGNLTIHTSSYYTFSVTLPACFHVAAV